VPIVTGSGANFTNFGLSNWKDGTQAIPVLLHVNIIDIVRADSQFPVSCWSQFVVFMYNLTSGVDDKLCIPELIF